eukprot:gnl/MRDRNA2_/MRDRNA2_114362_c0_seq1.p1 gnl/MRDRNA2_/MRDRNA2_114362_c0~~gnl/MRDRNA2_/MRDRNA2_114362_c0_seq1.p1  ORF type:complete len:384 (+),score=65.70 gnl/MRDRNA2_/MRDRNA2_114362_c0_seq1:74-1225(+)
MFEIWMESANVDKCVCSACPCHLPASCETPLLLLSCPLLIFSGIALFWWVTGSFVVLMVVLVISGCCWFGGSSMLMRSFGQSIWCVMSLWFAGMFCLGLSSRTVVQPLVQEENIGSSVRELPNLVADGAYEVYFKDGYAQESLQVNHSVAYKKKCSNSKPPKYCDATDTMYAVPIFERQDQELLGADAVVGWCIHAAEGAAYQHAIKASYCNNDGVQGLCGRLKDTAAHEYGDLHSESVGGSPYQAAIATSPVMFGWDALTVDRLKGLPLMECVDPGQAQEATKDTFIAGVVLHVLALPPVFFFLVYCCQWGMSGDKHCGCRCCGVSLPSLDPVIPVEQEGMEDPKDVIAALAKQQELSNQEDGNDVRDEVQVTDIDANREAV